MRLLYLWKNKCSPSILLSDPFKPKVSWETGGQVGELPESYLLLLDLAEDSHCWDGFWIPRT